ncbi:MAG: GIDE domain-containing protein [Candidatus Micrarchaeota archaeon]
MWQLVLMGIVGLGIGLAAIHSQRKEDEELYKIQRLPPTELEDAVADVVTKANGKVVPIKLLKSYYQKQDCVYFVSTEEEYRKQGKSSKWVTVFYDYGFEPFYIDDGTGKIRVDLLGEAKRNLYNAMRMSYTGNVNPVAMMGRMMEVARNIPPEQLIASGNEAEVSNSEFEKVLDWKGMKGGAEIIGGIRLGSVQSRKHEWILRPGAELFVYGMTRNAREGLLTMQPDKEAKMVASTKTESEYLKIKRSDDKTQMAIGYLALIGGIAMIVADISITMGWWHGI